VPDAHVSKIDGCLWRVACVYSTQLNRPLWNKEPITKFKNPHCRKYFCQKLIQLSEGNNVLDAAASIIDGLLWRDTFLSSTQLNRPF
jgi:glutaredoxin 2